jgi:biopolymer transport protein ExbD
MADIVFLLIVFFVLTYNTEVDRIQVELPNTWVRTDIPKKAALISVDKPDKGSAIRISTGEEMSILVSTDEEIVTFASNVVAEAPDKEFIIKADAGVRYERIDAVLDAVKQAKVKYIFLLSNQQTVDE